jgi:photosystem II stability/assembly factor-like uncharacterized protein
MLSYNIFLKNLKGSEMKKALLFLLVICFSLPVLAQEYTSWKWLHQKPQGNSLRWVKAWDANNWYAVGLNGTFMKTTDGGATWYFHHRAGVFYSDSTSDDIYTSHFSSMNKGIVAGSRGVMITNDGGQTFQPLATPLSTSSTIYGAYFVNDTVGYIAGTSSVRIAKTTDGGLTWTLNTIITSATYYDIYVPNDTTIIAASSSGNIRRSTDGGLTFATINLGYTNTVYKLAFKNERDGWAVGAGGKASYTTDGGITWTNVSTGLPAGTTFYDVDYRMDGSTEQIVLTGDSYDLYATTDMGTTWTQIDFLAPYANQPWTSTYYSTEFIGDKFVTVGGAGLINSRVGTATPVAHATYKKAGIIYDIYAESPTGKLIAVGAPGITGSIYDQIFYSTDGGINWALATTSKNNNLNQAVQFTPDYQVKGDEDNVIEALTPTSSSTFRAIDMATPLVGYISGSLSAVYKTTDGGISWDSLTTPLTSSIILYDVDFVDANTGWVAGASGNLLATTDGGATWTTQASGTTSTIYAISMVNSNVGWFAGSGGMVKKTTDGGATWTSQTSGFGTSAIYNIKMVSETTGYISGSTSKIAKTTDGGTTWNMLTLPSPFVTTATLYALDFRDENYGIVGGSSSKTALTTDGGATWTADFTANTTVWNLRIALSGIDTTAVYAVGNTGSILVNPMFLVPVELSSFNSSVSGSSVTLNWTTTSEKNNSGFAVERRSLNGSYNQIVFIPGNGTTTEVNYYSFTDKNLSSGIYEYRLKQIDYDGTYSYSAEVIAEISNPTVFALDQNYPNPFNPVTTIRYSLPVNELVTLAVYNTLGEKVRTIINNIQEAGVHEISFAADNLPSGIYFYKLEAGTFSSIKKMLLLK